jgi:hypothetical protein
MKQTILHSEIVKVSQTVRQWFFAIVFLIDSIYFIMMLYYYNLGIIPNSEFRKDDFIAITVILTIVSFTILMIVYHREFKLTIDENKLVIKEKGIKSKSITKNMITSYKNISKKEYNKLINEDNKSRRRRKSKRIKNKFVTGTPNFLVILTTGEKIFVQTNRKASFEYAMDKMLSN